MGHGGEEAAHHVCGFLTHCLVLLSLLAAKCLVRGDGRILRGIFGICGIQSQNPTIPTLFLRGEMHFIFPRILLTAIPNHKREPINETVNPDEGGLYFALLDFELGFGYITTRKDALESADSPSNSGVRWMRRSHCLPFLS